MDTVFKTFLNDLLFALKCIKGSKSITQYETFKKELQKHEAMPSSDYFDALEYATEFLGLDAHEVMK